MLPDSKLLGFHPNTGEAGVNCLFYFIYLFVSFIHLFLIPVNISLDAMLLKVYINTHTHTDTHTQKKLRNLHVWNNMTVSN